MLAGPLRAASVVASAIVIISFGLFALDETRAASERSAAGTAGHEAARTADPNPEQERARERVNSDTRELIDDADDILLSPFTWAAPDSGGKWSERGVPALLAVLVYGIGLSFLARFASGIA